MPPRNTRRSVQDKPKITGLDIMSITREEAPEDPYTFPFNGRVLTINDPMEDSWQNALKIDPNNAVAVLRSLMSAEDWKHFYSVRMEGWRLVALLKHVYEYYRISPEDLGNAPASPTS